MSRKHRFPKVPRKLGALYVCLALLLVMGWTVALAKLATLVTALVALYTAFATGHAATDIFAARAPGPPAPPPAQPEKELD